MGAFQGITAFLKNAGLKLPVQTLKATDVAFQADAILHTVIAILVRRFLHQKVKRHRAIYLVHLK